jgi:putative ABC transport system permease protein
MNKQFILKLALKNILTHKLRSFLTFLGIGIGITAIVFLVAFAFGLEKLVTDEVTGGDAFKLVEVGTGNSQIIKIDQRVVEQIKQFSNVKKAEIIINAAASAQKGQNNKMDLSFYGTSPQYLDWLGLKVKWGRSLTDSLASNEVVINTACLKFLGLSPESAINQKAVFDITIPQEISGEQKIVVSDQEFKIVGLIEDEAKPNAYINYQKLIELGAKNYSQVKVELNNKSQVPILRAQIENLGLKTQYVGDTVGQISEVFGVFKIILATFGLVALLVAVLGMFNTLTISLLERTREIALMKILGMRKKDINRLFLVEAILFGLIGGLAGLISGLAFGRLANQILNYFAIQAGGSPTSIFYYPLWFMFLMFVFSLLVGLLTGLYPAKRAAKLDALDVLRYE